MAEREHFGPEQQYQAPTRSIWDGDWMPHDEVHPEEDNQIILSQIAETDEYHGSQPKSDWS